MKSILFLTSLLIITSFTISKNTTEEIKQINYGVDFCSGKCNGYCKKEVQKNKIDTVTMTSEGWKNVCKYVEIEKFFKVAEITGCPGCSDGGIEWIEIVTSKRIRKIKFEYDHNIKEIGGLLVILRNRK